VSGVTKFMSILYSNQVKTYLGLLHFSEIGSSPRSLFSIAMFKSIPIGSKFFKAILFGYFALFALGLEARLNKTLFGGLAVEGYDPVSYFTEGEPRKGKKAFEWEYMDAKWRFESQANLDLFMENPAMYAPQFGGYCAWAVSQGYTAGIDPKVWNIVDGKLYLNYSRSTRERWSADIENLILAGHENWKELKEG
jgi:hypothetical protein